MRCLKNCAKLLFFIMWFTPCVIFMIPIMGISIWWGELVYEWSDIKLSTKKTAELQDAVNDVRRLREDYNLGRNGVTSSDVWVAQGYLTDVVEKSLKG